MQLTTLLATAATLLTAVSAGGFSSTCNSCRLGSSNTLYGCLCYNNAGKEIYNIVDLNDCMVNVNGQLSPRAHGGFGGSCSPDGQNDQYSPCWTCGNGSGTDRACPDLNSFLSNQNGALVCDDL